jgi:plasmid maintenance system antidote protein VapI
MALRLAAVFETEAELWANLQTQHDLWTARQEDAPKLKSLRQAA